MIVLDQNIPFVHAALNGAFSEAAKILHAAEERHGLRWSVSFSVFEVSDDDHWYREHLWPFLSETHLVMSGGDLQGTGRSLLDANGTDRTPTWRHWGSILAEWANLHWVVRPSGFGRTKWTRASRPWEYLDFYSHDDLSYLVADYDLWCGALQKIFASNIAGT